MLFSVSSRFAQKLTLLEPYITLQDTKYRLATPSKVRLMAFLYHVSQGVNYRSVSNQFGIGISNVSKCVHDVTFAILRHMYKVYIRRPTAAEGHKSMQAWERQIGIPGIVSALDDMHIAIKKPSNRGEAEVYWNRKSFYSINVQGITFLVL